MLILLTVAGYFLALLLFSRLTTRRSDNDTFFRGNRRSPWYMVAFGMVGASISGITFVSVPGMVGVDTGMPPSRGVRVGVVTGCGARIAV